MTLKFFIEYLLTDDKTGQALSFLVQETKDRYPELAKDFIQATARFQRLVDDKKATLINKEDFNIEKNKLNLSLYAYLEALPEELLNKEISAQQKKVIFKPWLHLFIFLFIIGVILVFLFQPKQGFEAEVWAETEKISFTMGKGLLFQNLELNNLVVQHFEEVKIPNEVLWIDQELSKSSKFKPKNLNGYIFIFPNPDLDAAKLRIDNHLFFNLASDITHVRASLISNKDNEDIKFILEGPPDLKVLLSANDSLKISASHVKVEYGGQETFWTNFGCSILNRDPTQIILTGSSNGINIFSWDFNGPIFERNQSGKNFDFIKRESGNAVSSIIKAKIHIPGLQEIEVDQQENLKFEIEEAIEIVELQIHQSYIAIKLRGQFRNIYKGENKRVNPSTFEWVWSQHKNSSIGVILFLLSTLLILLKRSNTLGRVYFKS